MNSVMTYLFGNHSIQGRLTAIAFLFIIGTAVTMGIISYRFTVNYEIERFHNHYSVLATYLAGNAELGVLLGNREMLLGLIETVQNLEDTRHIEIINNTGDVLAQQTSPADNEETFLVSAPVVSRSMSADHSLFLDAPQQQQLGEVRISYTPSSLIQLKRDLAIRYLLISLLLSTAPALMYWTLSRGIVAPLQNLVGVAGRVSQGDLEVRAGGGKFTETQALARALNDMLDALQQQRRRIEETNAAMARQQVLAEVGKFSMTVAHEIKNPLSIIKGSLGILRKPQPITPEVKQEMVGFIDEEIKRINTLVEDFLLFARPGAIAINDILVVDLLSNLTARLRLFNERLNVTLNVSASVMEQYIPCDIALFERALHNVIRNALESCDDRVQIEVEDDGAGLLFMIKDNGPGFPPDILDQIFEPFFSTRAKGTGLGLAIAREVMTAHKGSITARNRTSKGACAELRLPLAGEL